MSVLQILEILVAIGAIIHATEYGVKLYSYLRQRQTQSTQTTSSPRDVALGVFYSLVCAVLWSISYVSLSYVSQKVDAFSINVFLLGSATFCFFVLYLIVRIYARLHSSPVKGLPENNVDWRTGAPWITAAANLANFILFIYALYFVSASQVITLSKTNPLFVVMLTWLWLRHAPPRSAISAVALVVLGTLLIMFNENLIIRTGSATYGSLLAVLAGASFAVFSIGLEKIEQAKPTLSSRLLFMAVAFLLAYIGVISAAYFVRKMPVLPTDVVLILAANGLRVALVYVLYEAAVRRVGALLVSILVAFEVPFTMLWDSRLLHRPPVPRLIFGAAAILFGAVTLALDRSRGMSQQATS